MRPEPLLQIHLFEPLRVQIGDRVPIDENYTRRKAKALFVYLYLNRGRQLSKYQILADLWPEIEHADPGRVKHTVQVLRSTLEGAHPAGGWHIILERGGFYSFNAALDRSSDIEDFDQELMLAGRMRAAGDDALALAHYHRAFELHRGRFLSEFRYDDWAAVEIARVHDLYLQALEEASKLEQSAGNHTHAVELLRLAIAEDQLYENAYVQLMHSLWLDGRRTEALLVFQRLRDVLERRLQVEPQAKAQRLYEAIRRDQAIAV